MKKNIIFLAVICFFVFNYFANSQQIIKVEKAEQKGTASVNKEIKSIEAIPLPATQIKPNYYKPRFLKNKMEILNYIQENELIESISGKTILQDNEYSAYIIDTRDESLSYLSPAFTISETAKEAIGEAPLWLEDQLLYKFRLLATRNLDVDYAQLILDAPIEQKDEVAFVIAYMSLQSLSDSRFLSDKEMILRNAAHIYKVDDSLQYVEKVEYGSFEARDYYTTTKYRIFDPSLNDTIWSEVPKEIYYFYVVHPKLDQEGVYAKDNVNSKEQRTYGYEWRHYIWSNPDPNYNYQPVNVKTSKGSVDSIPRFGELMQQPKILWDRRRTYFPFGRPFLPSNHALDMIGNWGSLALPVDVTLPRSFQPNQILMKHDGMCNEDAFLMAGACRTALIPLIYLGTWSMDHVFGAIYDEGWNHFEFFRGGLAPSGNSAYGITNMMEGGSYGWDDALVEGFRPDGYPINLIENYAETCTFNVSVTDTLGNPIEGAKLIIYAAPSAYSSNPDQAGTIWTDFNGKVTFLAGEKKQYLVQIYHPKYGWAPQDSTKAFYLTNFNSTANAVYNVTIPYFNVKIAEYSPELLTLPETAEYGVNLQWSARDILTAENKRDGQRSRFYKWNDENTGEVSFFLCDSVNFEKFKKKEEFSAYSYEHLSVGGDLQIALPGSGKWFAVFSNHNFTSYYQFVESKIELIKDFKISVKENSLSEIPQLLITPNPASDYISIKHNLENNAAADLKILNSIGEVVFESKFESSSPFILDAKQFPSGIYYCILKSAQRNLSQKFIITK
ncbi:MAG: T9SS type A sorting domain-containing protein [Ignavibacteria bacterium]|nr:T9SS type A sorting domain-containing protein [Ignavibacteria bacterium]